MSNTDARLIALGIGVVAIMLQNIFIVLLAEKHKREQIEREEKLQQWLFDALYSINNKVVLPDSHEIKEDDNLKASVYSPEEDPMSEFEGVRDDWHK